MFVPIGGGGLLAAAIEHAGARVWIEPSAVLYLLGTQMDFEATKLRTGFVFRNPNQTSACGCGESVELRPAAPEKLEQALESPGPEGAELGIVRRSLSAYDRLLTTSPPGGAVPARGLLLDLLQAQMVAYLLGEGYSTIDTRDQPDHGVSPTWR